MTRDERRFAGLARLIWGGPIIVFLLAVLHMMATKPVREREALEASRQSAAAHQKWLDERPAKIDVRGMTPEQLTERYGIKDGRTKLKDHTYVLADGALWRVDDTW
jgi:hypothetical protein